MMALWGLCFSLEIISAWLWLVHALKLPITLLAFYSMTFLLMVGVGLLVVLIKREPPSLKETIFHVVIVGMLLTAFFKTVIYDYRSDLAWGAIAVLLCLALFVRLCNRWWWGFWDGCWSMMRDPQYRQGFNLGLDLVMIVAIFAWIWVKDIEAVVARMMFGEQFHHLDNALMGPGWAYLKGSVLNVDVLSQYGIGMPLSMAHLSELLGGFRYETVVFLLMVFICIYYVMAYCLLRLWIPSWLLATSAWLIGFKCQMFYTLSYPCILTYPQSSVLRFFFDVPLMFLLWAYAKKRHNLLSLAVGVGMGVNIWWVTSTGLYVSMAVIIALGILGYLRGEMKQTIKHLAIMISAAMGCAGLLLWLSVKNAMLEATFWRETWGFMGIFTSGLMNVPLWDPLRYAQYWDLIIAAVWVFSLLGILLAIVISRRIDLSHPATLLATVMAIYGLGSLEHWITMTMGNNYYSKSLPFWWCLFWAIDYATKSIKAPWLKGGKVMIFALSVFALATNHHAMSYPNLWNVSSHPMTDTKTIAQPLPTGYPYIYHKYRQLEESKKTPANNLGNKDEQMFSEYDIPDDAMLVRMYRQESQFPDDVRLIKELTKANDKVALISSFEISLLLQADRQPLFFIFPFLDSRPMRFRTFPWDQILAKEQIDRILSDLEKEKPDYIFVERMFIEQPSPPNMAHDYPGLYLLLNYIREHYDPKQQGYYLMAMQRR